MHPARFISRATHNALGSFKERILSSMRDKRVAASNERSGPKAEITGDKAALVKKVHDALYDSYRSANLPANLLQA